MATLYITEYTAIMDDRIQIPLEPPVAEQTLAIGSASVRSVPFSGSTRVVRIACDSICSVSIGTNPTATTLNGRLAANQTEFRGVQSGMSLAVIANT